MFFGTNTTPGANRDSYVFFPYAGYYPTQESVTSKGEAGACIVKRGATYKRFWMTGSLGTNANGGATASVQDVYQTWAMQIRCVKNTVKK
ncbi:hypothetical protein [Sphingobacterium sp.]|uniref:hypothetical protein n=1 Tax=Sphingobacterium sp. TaxID=341027 RepID=UPI0028A83A26|nr:hypothetical protein [Sphingobacterium sp.]